MGFLIHVAIAETFEVNECQQYCKTSKATPW